MDGRKILLKKAAVLGICLSLALILAACNYNGRTGDYTYRESESSRQQTSQSQDDGFLTLPLTIHAQWSLNFSEFSQEEEKSIVERKTIAAIMKLLEDKEQREEPYTSVPEDALHLQIQEGEGNSYQMDVWKEGGETCIRGETQSFTAPEETYDTLYIYLRSGAF